MQERKCEECGKPLVRRAKEPPSCWKKRRYCSRECAIIVSKRHLAALIDK